MNVNIRKKKIIDAAHRLFIEKGFYATSIQDIVNDANISKGTFYNYFVSKNECLLAILESVQEEGNQKRIELSLGKSIKDEDVFIHQIAVRSNMNRKYNMLILFESIMHLNEPDIETFLEDQYRDEVQWIANRICEIYSPEYWDYALDHAVMFLGMFQHFMYVWKMETDEEFETEKVIRFILNRLKPIIDEQIQSGEKFFARDWFGLDLDEISTKELLSRIVNKIDRLLDKVELEQLDYLRFLKEEIQTDTPRKFLIESIILSLTNMFEETILEHEIRQLVQITEKYYKNI
ncbi:TetR/AcrR family transcriptional regulator [Paucisalibacillus sp. EB02]|uniref:TetR/AcrR family transcriptional regulator n=1 Tax=Paucisalibacillus sp. EB02 TaxID=1347087 RepID=UPI0005A7B936|nr:TetR/AcrR family transcriptional regulator [Paucisalibacillus sp. EB02]